MTQTGIRRTGSLLLAAGLILSATTFAEGKGGSGGRTVEITYSAGNVDSSAQVVSGSVGTPGVRAKGPFVLSLVGPIPDDQTDPMCTGPNLKDVMIEHGSISSSMDMVLDRREAGTVGRLTMSVVSHKVKIGSDSYLLTFTDHGSLTITPTVDGGEVWHYTGTDLRIFKNLKGLSAEALEHCEDGMTFDVTAK